MRLQWEYGLGATAQEAVDDLHRSSYNDREVSNHIRIMKEGRNPYEFSVLIMPKVGVVLIGQCPTITKSVVAWAAIITDKE